MILTSKSTSGPVLSQMRPEQGKPSCRAAEPRYGRGLALVQSLCAAFLLCLSLLPVATMAQTPTSNPGSKPARTLKLVALGDSLTAGYNLPASAAFPPALELALRAKGHAVEIVNAGVSGDTVQGGLERLEWSVPDGTDGVILELGANDALRGLDPAVTRRGLEAIITKLKARGIPVLLTGMYAPRNLGTEYATRFDSIYPELAKAHGLVLYPFFLEGVAGDRALNQPDLLHPTAEGVRVIVRNILPTVERFLATLPAKS
jgi:acyl-CoA thioesterase-1